MGFDLTVGPLDGIDEPDAGDDWFEYCLAEFEAVNEYLASQGLPAHHEPRSIGGAVYLGYRQPLAELIELDVLLPEELQHTFNHVLSAGLNSLFIPVDLPEPVRLSAGGDGFLLGSVPRLLVQAEWLQRVVDGEPLDGFPTDLPIMEGGGTAGAALSQTLCWAAGSASATNSSIRIC